MSHEMGKCDGCTSPAVYEDWETGFCQRWCRRCMADVKETRDRPAREARAEGGALALSMVGAAVALVESVCRSRPGRAAMASPCEACATTPSRHLLTCEACCRGLCPDCFALPTCDRARDGGHREART